MVGREQNAKTLVVREVVREHDRTLIYGPTDDYHLIGSKDCVVKPGDVVHYEPYGANFGWLVERQK